MSIVNGLMLIAKRIVANIIRAAERLTSQGVLVTSSGDIIIKEPLAKTIADKLSAVVIASAALFFLLSPIQGKTAMAIGDQLIRAATMLWSGAEPDFAT
jgi:hypothetical protein